MLHIESRERLDTIGFWEREVLFFNDLLNKKSDSKKAHPNKEKLLKSLNIIHENLFKNIEKSVLEHEKLLSRVLPGSSGLFNAIYREKHQKLYVRMLRFTDNFKSFKTLVFDYIKNR